MLRRAAVAGLIAVLTLVLVAGSTVAGTIAGSSVAGTIAGSSVAGTTAGPAQLPGRAEAWPTSGARPVAGVPTRLRIPAIGVDAGLVTVGLDAAGALQPPTDIAKPGWYAEGTAPGDVGPAVIVGHLDSRRGPAVFFRLHALRTGDVIEVARGGGWVRFRVVEVGRYAKNRFPTGPVYGPTPDAQLRLVTCGGAFDRSRRSYRDNIVVFAVLA